MPRVKVDYVVSFSSEHPEHPANNLVASEVSKKRWLCHPGESSCSVVLQLARAVQISSVNIGAYNTAFIEVLVGRSEGSGEQFQVLVARSVLQTPSEARRAAPGAPAERVRAFSGDQLTPAAAQRWDRLRLVCSQPYNKHCQFGLSFVHVYEPEGGGPPSARPAPLAPLALDTYSSSEDEFRPGELFATHQKDASHTDTPAATPAAPINTETQIRQATSQALKNVCESSTKLKKTPIAKAEARRAAATPEASPRARPSLTHRRSDTNDSRTTQLEQSNRKDKRRKSEEREANTGRDERDAKRPRRAGDDAPGGRDKEGAGGPLAGAVVSLSGYANPRRAALRALAGRLGARVRPHWSPACTHLICAFPRTPKLQQASQGGRAVRAARGEWLHAMAACGRRLPWRWFASDPRLRQEPPPHWDQPPHSDQPPSPTAPATDTTPPQPSDCDTDDEIEEVLRKQKQREINSPARTSDVADQAPENSDSDATVEGDVTPRPPQGPGLTPLSPGPPPLGPGLPAMFEGRTFVVSNDVTGDKALLTRYIQAYGGLVLQEESDGEPADYWVGPGGPGAAVHVSPAWVWRCHREGRLLPPD